jgi:predicted O-methyltransferase YrrM
MPLARTSGLADGKPVTTIHEALADRSSRWSDIQEYLPLFYSLARTYPAVRVLELGSRKGNSTLAFLAGAEESGGHVWSNDIDDIACDPDGMGPWAGSPLWTFIHGDDMDPQVQARLPQQVDVLFIDTSHEYEHTVRELGVFMPRVAPGGVALFHDTRFVFADWDGSLPPVGRAVDEYCARTGKKWLDLPGQYGLGVLRP